MINTTKSLINEILKDNDLSEFHVIISEILTSNYNKKDSVIRHTLHDGISIFINIVIHINNSNKIHMVGILSENFNIEINYKTPIDIKILKRYMEVLLTSSINCKKYKNTIKTNYSR